MEPFFDVVYALAMTELTRHLLQDLSLAGAGRTFLLLLAVWWAWNYTSWFTNWFDPDLVRFDIAVDDAVAMRVSEAGGNFSGDAQRVGERELCFLFSRVRSDSPSTYGMT